MSITGTKNNSSPIDKRAANINRDDDEEVKQETNESIDDNNNDIGSISDKDELINKIKNTPIDKLKEIITNQIDLEIRLKHKELTLTDEEIGKCEAQMITLRNYFKIPGEKSLDNEPNDFTLKYYDLLNRTLTSDQGPKYSEKSPSGDSRISMDTNSSGGSISAAPTHSYRTRSTTSSLRPSSSISHGPLTLGCLYRRTDGIIVKLTCPDCNRSNFSSAQGFLNHSRIAHVQEYTSQDAAALICGEILPENEQDEEGLNSLKNLKLKGMDPGKNLNVNEIYFNGLSNSLNTVHKSSLEKSLSPLEVNEQELVKPSVQSEPESSELMKKLIKSGIASDKASYDSLIKEYKTQVDNGHLFENEEEIEDDDEPNENKSEKEEPSTSSGGGQHKRRRSRANVGIVTSSPIKSESPIEGNSETSLPKLKFKIKNNDKKKKKKTN